MKKILAYILTICLILSLAPMVPVYAEDEQLIDPGYTGGTLIAHYELNDEFVSSDIGKIIFKNIIDEETDGYKVTCGNDGIKVERTAETGTSTQIKKIGFNLAVPAVGGKDDLSATNYKLGLDGMYAIEQTFDLQIIKLGSNSGRTDLYFTASDILDSDTAYSTVGNNHIRFLPSYVAYYDTANNTATYSAWDKDSEVIDLKLRTVLDTMNKKAYNYIINADGSYTYVGEADCSLNSINSITFAPRGYVAKGSYVKFKDIKIYELGKNIDLNAELAKITSESITGGETVKADLTLPGSTDSGCTVEWDSKNDDIISDKGVLNTEIKLEEDTTVTFTVTVSYSGNSVSKDINFVIAKTEEIPIPDPDKPDYTGGKLIADYDLNEDFVKTNVGKMVVVESFDKSVDGFEATYTDDGITITQTNEGTESTAVNKFALNLVTCIDKDEINNTETYQTGLAGIYAVELTMQMDYRSNSKRTDMYFNPRKAVNAGPTTTAHNFRIYTSNSSYWQGATDGGYVDQWTDGEDWTLRFVVDTFKQEIYGYNVDENGNCEYKFTAPYTGNTFDSITYAPRYYVPQGYYVTFKNMKIFEIEKDTNETGNLFYDAFNRGVPESLVADPYNVTENFTMPSVVGGITSSNVDFLGIDGKVSKDFEDRNEYIKISSNSGDTYYDKYYNVVIKKRDDISVKDLEFYDYSNEEDFYKLKELGDGKVTAEGYEIANTASKSGVVGMLQTVHTSDENTATYYFDHKGAQDLEITLNSKLTAGAVYAEVGNYDAENDNFTVFGKVRITPEVVEYCDAKEDLVAISESTNGKDYALKFRTFVDEKKIWLWVNGDKLSEIPFTYSNSKTFNAFRIYMDGASEDDTVVVKKAELIQQIPGVPATDCLNAISAVGMNMITNNPSDAYGSINLPNISGYNVVWSTDNPLADLEGKMIYRSMNDEDITITALVSKASDPTVKVKKEFYLKVKAASNESELLEGASAKITPESITNQNPDALIADLELPSKSAEGYKITWDSLNDGIISDSGVINKNINISKDTPVVLRATVTGENSSNYKEVKFTVAKRGKDISLELSELVENAENVVTYSATLGNADGNAYLCDGAGNKILGIKVFGSKLSLEYKNAPVNEFEIYDGTVLKVVMNSNDSKLSVYANDKLLADYVPYLENALGFKNVSNNGLIINAQNVVFDEYSLIDYNIAVYDYFDVLNKGYFTENVEFKKSSLGGVNVLWSSSDEIVMSDRGEFTTPAMIVNFDITATLSVNGGTDAKLVKVIKGVGVPDEDENLFKGAKTSCNITEDVDNDRTKAFDSDLNTYFEGKGLKEKSYIIIDMGVMKDINSLYFFRAADDENINSCDIYVSKDGQNWGDPVAVHSFAGIESNQVVFELQNARYVKITNIDSDDKTLKLYEIKGYVSYSADDKAHLDILALDMPKDYILTAEKIVLPSKGSVYGSDLKWTSSDTSVISLDGTVKNPSKKTEVVLTVTAELDGKTSVKSFIYLVNGKSSAGGAAGGGGSSNVSGIHTGGTGMAALPSAPQYVQTPSEDNLKTEFNDVKVSDWYYSYLIDLKNKGIVDGYDDGNFYPNKTVTREEFVKMVVSAAGLELDAEKTGFNDVNESDWFAPYVYTAKAEGIINGIDENNFGVGMAISRQDMSVIICNLLDKNIPVSGDLFKDDANIAPYARNAVYSMKTLGVLNGYSDGTFNPKGNLTRAEAVKVIALVLAEL